MLNSKIAWTNNTLNFWTGCTRVSPGCVNCYFYTAAGRYGLQPTELKRTGTWHNVKKFKPGDKVFVGSWMDFFHPGGDDWRSDAWDVIRSRPDLIWQIVTKRPENMKDRMPSDWGDGWPNVWLIATTENQETADKRIPILLDVPAVVHGVSVEPMLDAVILAPYLSGLDWVICGGESGPGARPMELSWAYNLKDQCKEYSKPFFFKQTGAALAKQLGYNDRKFGGDISEFPESLRVREYPHQGD